MTTPRLKQPDEERYARGLQILRRIGGEDYDGPVKRLAQTSPDLSRLTVEYPYGDILSLPGLALPLRQLCTVGMLIADGSAQPQLKFHMTEDERIDFIASTEGRRLIEGLMNLHSRVRGRVAALIATLGEELAVLDTDRGSAATEEPALEAQKTA